MSSGVTFISHQFPNRIFAICGYSHPFAIVWASMSEKVVSLAKGVLLNFDDRI